MFGDERPEVYYSEGSAKTPQYEVYLFPKLGYLTNISAEPS